MRKMMTKKRGKRYKRKNRPVTQTDRYWFQLGILEGRELRIKEHKRGQADYKDRYYNQMRANQWLVHEMDRIDPELTQSKKISLQKRTVLKIIEILEGTENPQGLYLLRVLRQKIEETETASSVARVT